MKIIACIIFVFWVVIWFVLPSGGGGPDSNLDGVLNAIYTIENQKVHLVGGRSETQAAPGSAAKIITMLFGKSVLGDLDGDGRDDAALFLMHNPGGSGTFYYIAAAIAKNGNYQGTNGVLLGDRVTPRRIQIRNNVIVVYYEDRHPDEPMTVPPSILKTMYLKLKEGHLEAIKTSW